jgi:hypothetical protein
MKLLWHVIAWDLRQHRLLIGVWLLIVATAAAFYAIQPLLDLDARAGTALTTVGGLLWISEVLIGALLIALVVQTHPVVGSNAFWMTRPIRPDVLLSAKAVMLTSLVVLWPTIVEAVGAVAYHGPFLQVIEVAVQSALDKAMWLVIGAVFAALTRSVARFVMAVGATLLFLAASLAIAMAVLVATMEADVEAGPSVQTFDDPTGGLVMLVLSMGAGAMLLLVQYRTRSPFKAVATGIIACAASVLAAMAWPWPLLATRVDDAHWAEARGRGRLTASAESVKASRNAEGTAARPMWRAVTARLQIEDVEPGWSIHVTLQEAVLRVAGGPELAGAPFGAWLVPGVGGDRTATDEAIRSVLEVNRLVGRSTTSNSQTVLYLRDAEFRRFAPTSGTYTARFQVTPTRHEVEAVIGLEVGATQQDGAYRAVIERVTYAPGAVLVELRESNAWTVFDRRLQPERTYYLRNAGRSEAIGGSAERSGSWGLPFGFYATMDTGAWSGFGARRLKLEFPPPGLNEEQTLSLDDRWLDGAELVIVRATQARAFDRRLEITGFPLRLDTTLADENVN